jgi:SAM-dependent methyltransferase
MSAWGAVLWKKMSKSNVRLERETGSPNIQSHNWLVHKIHDEVLARLVMQYASGILVDVGCGEKPYAGMTRGWVAKHIGVDHASTQHDPRSIDILASAYHTTLPDSSADTTLCTVVMEHLERPAAALEEMYRILKPGGFVIASAPLFWHVHEEPRDFYRFTRYGLEYLLTQAGFEIIELLPLSGFAVTFAQELCYLLEGFRRGLLHYPVRTVQFILQFLAYKTRAYDHSYQFTWAYLVVAQKPACK